MNNVQVKYEKLDPSSKKEAYHLIERFREKLLKVSIWSEEDIKAFEENAKFFNNWKIEEW